MIRDLDKFQIDWHKVDYQQPEKMTKSVFCNNLGKSSESSYLVHVPYYFWIAYFSYEYKKTF